jgi:hypothetical protein
MVIPCYLHSRQTNLMAVAPVMISMWRFASLYALLVDLKTFLNNDWSGTRLRIDVRKCHEI